MKTKSTFLFLLTAFVSQIICDGQGPESLLKPKPEGYLKLVQCKCGKIHDLQRAKAGEFLWKAALVRRFDNLYKPRLLCFASVINSRYLLSSASCLSKYEANRVEVQLITRDAFNSTRKAVSKIKIHPFFSVGNLTYDNDIALIRLRDELILDADELHPICLPTADDWALTNTNFTIVDDTDDIDEDTTAYDIKISAWDECKSQEKISEIKTATMNKWKGFRVENYTRSYRFKQLDLNVISNDNCSQLYPARVRAQIVCGVARFDPPFKWSWENCQGDPGAILQAMTLNDECVGSKHKKDLRQLKFYQIGVSTTQPGCKAFGTQKKPTLVFTRVARYVSWIIENSNDGTFCSNRANEGDITDEIDES